MFDRNIYLADMVLPCSTNIIQCKISTLNPTGSQAYRTMHAAHGDTGDRLAGIAGTWRLNGAVMLSNQNNQIKFCRRVFFCIKCLKKMHIEFLPLCAIQKWNPHWIKIVNLYLKTLQVCKLPTVFLLSEQQIAYSIEAQKPILIGRVIPSEVYAIRKLGFL